MTPRSITSRCSSVRVKRPSGRPWVAGSSQAIALTSATCSGGKTARAARARSVGESLETLLEEAPSPATDDPGRGVKAGGDLDVTPARGCMEHDPSPLDLAPGTLLGPSDPRQL